MLEVKNLCKSFGGVHAMQDVRFTVRGGSVHSVIGPNGAGKTTPFNLISGVDEPTRGEILLDGESVGDRSPGATRRADTVLREEALRPIDYGRKLAEGTAAEGSPRWAWCRCWCARSSRSSRGSRPKASRSCWSSRTPTPRCRWPMWAMFWKPDAHRVRRPGRRSAARRAHPGCPSWTPRTS